jgi:hypothetical protein
LVEGRKEGKKERRKEGKKERRKEGKKERRKEGKNADTWLASCLDGAQRCCAPTWTDCGKGVEYERTGGCGGKEYLS